MKTSKKGNPVIQAIEEQVAAFRGPGRVSYFRPAAAGGCPPSIVPARGLETCGRLRVPDGCKGLVRAIAGPGKV